MNFVIVSDFLLAKIMDQKIYIKFYYENGIKCNKVLDILNTAFDESVVSKNNGLRMVLTSFKMAMKQLKMMSIMVILSHLQ